MKKYIKSAEEEIDIEDIALALSDIEGEGYKLGYVMTTIAGGVTFKNDDPTMPNITAIYEQDSNLISFSYIEAQFPTLINQEIKGKFTNIVGEWDIVAKMLDDLSKFEYNIKS